MLPKGMSDDLARLGVDLKDIGTALALFARDLRPGDDYKPGKTGRWLLADNYVGFCVQPTSVRLSFWLHSQLNESKSLRRLPGFFDLSPASRSGPFFPGFATSSQTCRSREQCGMNFGRTVFAQLMDQLPTHEFHKCVNRYRGNYKFRGFSCWDQFLCLAFAQLTYRESLRDIEACLRSVLPKLYHMGFRGKVSRSTMADANEAHDWHIYADFAQILIDIARPMYADEPF